MKYHQRRPSFILFIAKEKKEKRLTFGIEKCGAHVKVTGTKLYNRDYYNGCTPGWEIKSMTTPLVHEQPGEIGQ